MRHLRKLQNCKRRVRWFFQRHTRGYDDQAIWNADYAIAKYALPIVKGVREHGYGYPGELTPDEWHNILDEIIFGLAYVAHQDDEDYDEVRAERAKKGLQLFGKWFMALWT